jgi:hypothetical protein
LPSRNGSTSGMVWERFGMADGRCSLHDRWGE